MAGLPGTSSAAISESETAIHSVTSSTNLKIESASPQESFSYSTEVNEETKVSRSDVHTSHADVDKVSRHLSFVTEDNLIAHQRSDAFESAQSPKSLSVNSKDTARFKQSLQCSTSSPTSLEKDQQSTTLSPLHIIKAEEITEDKILGSGGFGSVHLAIYKGRKVVRKTFHSHHNESVIKETFNRELRALQLGLKHDNVVEMLGTSCASGWQDGAFIVMSYAGNVTLDSYLSEPRNQMTIQHILFFSGDIMEGLKYLHSRNVVHLDIKPANCIFSFEDQNVRLCDFGAMHVVGEPWKSQMEGTLGFRAPELFCIKNGTARHPSYSCDIYSLGVTMWSLDSRSFPFLGMNREVVIYSTVQYHLRPPLPKHNPAENNSPLKRFRDLYTRCWAADPEDRPSLEHAAETIDNIVDEL